MGDMNLDPVKEQKATELLSMYLKQQGYSDEYIDFQIKTIFDIGGGFISRFNLFEKFLEDFHYNSILVSGSSVGSELYVARQRGFKEAYGTEVSEIYKTITELRFGDDMNINTIVVEGVTLPFEDEKFETIMSGHIIEHTMAPEEYLIEHFRVLKPSGMFFLEFPDRMHPVELHTRTISFERYPLWLRNLCLRVMSSPLNPNYDARKKYRSVLESLLPIGERDIYHWLRKNRIKFDVVYTEVPAPGIKRIILKKLL